MQSDAQSVSGVPVLLPDRRYHFARKPIELAPASYIQRRPDMKPQGLWYDVGGEWWEWMTGETDWATYERFVHEVTVDQSRILTIRSSPELHEFNAEYGRDLPSSFSDPRLPNRMRFWLFADWPEVSKRYAGIEIAPYLWEERLGEVAWYYSWDVASGCIWDLSAVRLKYLGAFEPQPQRRTAP